MKLYNVLTEALETFEPAARPVTVYGCGITPYDTTHLGHVFTYAFFDVLIRYLRYRDYEVRYVQNVTDIDDDILKQADKVGEDWWTLGNRWTRHFIRDMITLNILPPDYFPRATDVIPEMIEIVQKLLDAGVAYEAGGSVYFEVDAWPEFGKLSRIPREEMLPIANQRGNDPDDPHKRDPLDFVLWQAQAPGEPAWDSPWGPGRPGWHMECSTMANKYLGDRVDIHGGGADLIFPHHECEIAQAECATGKQPFVRYWVHTAMVRYEGEKMSKSLGNLVMARDLLERWSPDAVRLCLASHHYRDSWEYREEELEEVALLGDRLRTAVVVEGGSGPAVDPLGVQVEWTAAMDLDLDTPRALELLVWLADEILDGAQAGQAIRGAQYALRNMAGVLGLRLDREEPEEAVLAGWNRHLQRFGGGADRP